MTRVRRASAALAVALLVVAVPACAGSDGDDDTITVFAAASLTDVFAELADAFEQTSPAAAEVRFVFGGSSSLREQLLAGAPADVLATANEETMAAVVDTRPEASSVVLATNRLALVVPDGNPGDVNGLSDLADASLLVGLCAEEVPCGALATDLLAGAGVDPSPDTLEPDVRALLTKVETGDLDVALVYETDVATARGVERIPVAVADAPTARYPIAVLDTDDPAAAAFVAFVLGDDGQAILRRAGFGPPA